MAHLSPENLTRIRGLKNIAHRSQQRPTTGRQPRGRIRRRVHERRAREIDEFAVGSDINLWANALQA